MRIVSLLPGATEILLALGLEDELVGITHRCEVPVATEDPAAIEDPAATDDPAVLTRPGSAGGDALDAAALVDADAELVIVGDGEDGGVTGRLVEAALADVERSPSVLTLAPASVEGVLNAIVAVGAMTEAEDEALAVVEGLRERLKGLQDIVLSRRDHGFEPPRVVLLREVDPPRTVGRWIPDQVRLAGGWELLGQAGGLAGPTSWPEVADLDPEVLVLLPGGRPLDEAVRAWEASARPEGWKDLRAVQQDRAWLVDGGAFVLAGPRVLDGIEILAELIDPLAFDGMSPPDTFVPAR